MFALSQISEVFFSTRVYGRGWALRRDVYCETTNQAKDTHEDSIFNSVYRLSKFGEIFHDLFLVFFNTEFMGDH